jgi:hypothetical protein
MVDEVKKRRYVPNFQRTVGELDMLGWETKMKKAILLAACLFVGCNTYPYHFVVNSVETIYTKNKSIAICPFSCWSDSTDSIHAIAFSILEDSIAGRLKGLDLNVIRSENVLEALNKIKNRYQGFYSIKSGKLDTTKLRNFREEIISKLCDSFNVSSVLFPFLIYAKAKVENGSVFWHDRIEGTTPFVSLNGEIPALSILVTIYNCNNKIVLRNCGGFSILDEFSSMGERKRISEDRILINSRNTTKSLDIVFRPLCEEYKNIRK